MTPDDKELIQLAARAFFGSEDEATHAIVSLGWNPKDNNEDAFMLAAWLGIEFRTWGAHDGASAHGGKALPGQRHVSPYRYHRHVYRLNSDMYVAARRAILEVAAEIGRDTYAQ
ncbi:hypothetical protein D9M68_158920 [compost metagenome]